MSHAHAVFIHAAAVSIIGRVEKKVEEAAELKRNRESEAMAKV